MGSFFSGGGSQTTSTSQQIRPQFGAEGQEVLGRLMGSIRPGEQPSGPGADFFLNMLQQQPGQINPYTQQLISESRQVADRDLQDQLAQGRSALQGTPLGRSQMALDDTVSRNRMNLNQFITQQLAGQSNLDLANQMQAASALSTMGTNEISSAMNLLSLLRGEDRQGTSTTESSQRMSPFQSLLGLGGMTGGLLQGLGSL